MKPAAFLLLLLSVLHAEILTVDIAPRSKHAQPSGIRILDQQNLSYKQIGWDFRSCRI